MAKWKAGLLAVIFWSLSAAVGAVSSLSASEPRLLFTVHGSNTVGASLMKNLLVAYLDSKGATDIQAADLVVENEYRVQGVIDGEVVYINVAAHGSSTAFKGLLGGVADVGMASRRIKDKEVRALEYMGNMRDFAAEHVVAIDGLAVIVNQVNPIDNLSLDQLAAIFSGQISDWSEVGGSPGKISIHARDNKSGTWDTFKNLVLRKKVKLSQEAARYESNDRLSDEVSMDPNAIGFVGLASVRDSKAIGVNEQGTDPLLPNKLTVATEDYPLARRLYVYTPPGIIPHVIRDFITFAQSDLGQKQVDKTGFISQNITSIPASADLQGPKEYLALTKDAQRLSVNFRFEQGKAELDNKAIEDIRRLTEYLDGSEGDQRLWLIGFGDTKQTEQRAKVLSKLRAVAIMSALRHAGVTNTSIAGFGAYKPVASNNSKSKIKNRRVEVWLR
ncbi:phosphate ABC transporter substrate-binding/OmpA family protein [Maricurvus nonylphenolicus]|uniref:substrate-binding domain-containing protein n=1 Tax=Maricurvus nonylphenolicus TaxID=1008307 RepID=UPI0036F1DAF3